MSKVGVIDYSVNCECGGGRDSREKRNGRRRTLGEERKREKKKSE
jgi:hypothetical protein